MQLHSEGKRALKLIAEFEMSLQEVYLLFFFPIKTCNENFNHTLFLITFVTSLVVSHFVNELIALLVCE